MADVHHVVSFSGGVGSYCAARRVVAEHGAANVTLLFADTGIEDEDLYRFLHEAADKLGAHLEIVADGRTPWEVFRDEKFIGNTRVDLCSRILKRDLLDAWITERYQPDEVVVYVGVDWTEVHRYERLAPRKEPYVYKAPMCEEPLVSKDDMLAILREDGLEVPRLYKMGFPHNNCGGFCVKAGQGHFKLLYEKMPERYLHHERQEERTRQEIGADVAILRDRRGGTTKPMTLKVFRQRLEEHDPDIDPYDFGGCGCAID